MSLYEKSILVTGGAGFIGSNLVLHLVRKYPQYRIINADALTYAGNLSNLREIEGAPNYCFEHLDVASEQEVQSLFERYPISHVIHLAAESHVDRSIHDPLSFVRTNVLGTVNLLQACLQYWDGCYKGHLYYQVSTDEVYGSLDTQAPPFTEEHCYDPHSPYSASKASADHFVRAFYDTYALPVVISNCSNNYGPYQFPEKLIPLTINNILHQRQIPIYGKGLQVRDWLHVQDHVEAIDCILHRGRPRQTYNIGGNHEMRNIDLVRKLIDIVDEETHRAPEESSQRLITYVSDRPGHDARYGIDASKVEKELGWKPRHTLDEGLRETVRWYLSHSHWLKEVTSGAYREYYDKMYSGR